MRQRKTYFKRSALIALTFLFLISLMAGCASKPGEDISNNSDVERSAVGAPETSDNSQSAGQAESTQPISENEDAIPGSYIVPDGWVKAEKYSSAEKVFYVEDGHEDDELPDNISIEVGTNRYSMDEHEKFRDAIVRQLALQLQGISAEMTGDGTYTEQDYIVYIFTISEESVVTKQYYIVGDQRYCLIHLTNFTGSESADKAAQTIADSFVWD